MNINFTDELIRNNETYVYENIDLILIDNPDKKIKILLDFIYNESVNKKQWLNRLSLNNNMYQRFLFMKELLTNYPQEFTNVYPNIIECLTSNVCYGYIQTNLFPEKISSEELSTIVYLTLKNKLDNKIYLKLKEYLLTNYPTNDLAQKLLEGKNLEEYEQDSNRLFETSRTYQFEIYKNHSDIISSEIIDKFNNYMQYLKLDEVPEQFISNSFSSGLGNDIKRCIDIYSEKSKDKTIEYLDRGNKTICLRIGDYVMKLSKGKWSYEDIICPNLYLIIKNEEEKMIRNQEGIVVAGLEIQKYLKKSANNLSTDHFIKFKKDLESLGYKYTDRLIGGTSGDNCKILDSYLDADCIDKESLPDSFKKTPLVLVDRDMVYPKEKKLIKQLSPVF